MQRNNKSLISVIIPTYNHATFLQRALKSLQLQTYTHWEAIVVDNHSTDNTEEVIAFFADDRIKHLKVHNNGIIALSRNRGINVSNGSFIAFLDADDWWSSAKLEKSLQLLETAQMDFVYHDLWIVRDLQRLEKEKLKTRVFRKSVYLSLLQKGNAVLNSSVLVRKDILVYAGMLDENPQIIASEDYDLWIRIALVTNKFIRHPECLGYYWYGGENISKGRNFAMAGNIILGKYKQQLSFSDLRSAEGYLDYLQAIYFIKEKDKKTAWNYLIRCVAKANIVIKLKAIYRLILLFKPNLCNRI